MLLRLIRLWKQDGWFVPATSGLELTDVFLREKFDKYLPFTVRENLLLVIEE